MSLQVTYMHMIPIIYAVSGKSQSWEDRGRVLFKDMEKDEPMICSNIASISHVIPLRPWLHLIFSDVPDALAPDYVFKP